MKPRAEFFEEPSETAREIHIEDRNTFTGIYAPNGAPLGFQPNRWNMAKKTKKTGKRKGC